MEMGFVKPVSQQYIRIIPDNSAGAAIFGKVAMDGFL
jgi:hypothetical protein